MRIHTNYLLAEDLHMALKDASDKAPNVELIFQGRHGSRSHSRAFEVALRGHGKRHTKRPNTGITGSRSDEYAATYDDWGWFAAALFARDYRATVGPYKGVDDFHKQTKDAYRF